MKDIEQQIPDIAKLREAASQAIEGISWREMLALVDSVTYDPDSKAGKLAKTILNSIFDETERIARKD